jgi:putative flippase GtrA
MPKYALIGVLNTLVNAGAFNLLMLGTGITRGVLVPIFSLVAFAVAIVHSFLWNKSWVFRDRASGTRMEFISFAAVNIATALLASGIIHLIVNVIGVPPGVQPLLWANVANVIIIPVAFLSNFFGLKFLVFKKSPSIETN